MCPSVRSACVIPSKTLSSSSTTRPQTRPRAPHLTRCQLKDKYGFTALMNAAYYNQAWAAKALCTAKGLDLHVKDRMHGNTALDMATDNKVKAVLTSKVAGGCQIHRNIQSDKLVKKQNRVSHFTNRSGLKTGLSDGNVEG